MLIDAGPLVSLCDKKQPSHAACQAVLELAPLPIVSTWACFVEAMYLVGRIGGFRLQGHLWSLLHGGILQLHQHADAEFTRMSALMDRYQNVPMDLADASLVAVAEIMGDRRILTLDSDFRIYRTSDGEAFDIVPE
jgi:predicted nucleic acid-binding protein